MTIASARRTGTSALLLGAVFVARCARTVAPAPLVDGAPPEVSVTDGAAVADAVADDGAWFQCNQAYVDDAGVDVPAWFRADIGDIRCPIDWHCRFARADNPGFSGTVACCREARGDWEMSRCVVAPERNWCHPYFGGLRSHESTPRDGAVFCAYHELCRLVPDAGLSYRCCDPPSILSTFCEGD